MDLSLVKGKDELSASSKVPAPEKTLATWSQPLDGVEEKKQKKTAPFKNILEMKSTASGLLSAVG